MQRLVRVTSPVGTEAGGAHIRSRLPPRVLAAAVPCSLLLPNWEAVHEHMRLPYVIDGASDFFYELFGPKAGRHARPVLGVADLPNGIAVEINGEFELRV